MVLSVYGQYELYRKVMRMEFSQYILDVLASIDYVEKDRDSCARSLTREAIENAPSEIESHILEIIAGVYSMCYDEKKQVFAPLIIWNDGHRSFAPEDLTETDLEVLRSTIQLTNSSYLRAKFSHIIWLSSKDNRDGERAVEGYLDGFRKHFDPENWVVCYEQIRLAYHIASIIGKKSECFKRTKLDINQKLIQMNGSDPLFLSLKLLDLIVEDTSKEEFAKYDSITHIIADRNFDSTNQNINLADLTFSVLEKMYRHMKKNDDLKIFKERYAGYYEAYAKALGHKKDYFRAIIMLKKACTLYQDVNKDKLLDLKILLADWQKIALQGMHIQEFKIDLEPVYNLIEQRFEGLSLTEAIIQFGRFAKIYKVDDAKKELLENQKHNVFASMFGTSILNEQGQVVHELPPIDKVTDSGDSDSMKKHMVHYVAEQRRIVATIYVRIAYQLLKRYGTITEDDLDFLVHNNAIVPKNREEIIKQGLCMGLNGKLYAAMHILQPQTENIFRNLVKMCGDTITFLQNDGTETHKLLSALFKSEKLRECYSEDIIFAFQSIMDDTAGENLRNLTSHGLLEPELGNSDISLYFLGLLIFWLSLYGAQAHSIMSSLAARQQREVKEQDVEDCE